jgi:c-di-GMP-binding flagellar brake protein YcgR
MDGADHAELPSAKRRYPRYEIETELSATILGVERREMHGRSLNINEGGIAGVFATGWDVGTPVNLQFSVPVATTTVRVRGVVRNRAGYRYGFEFVELTPQQQETISRTCRTLSLLE